MPAAWSSCSSWDSSNRARPDPADPEKEHLQHLGYLLHETGFRAIRTETTMLDFSYYHEDQEANRAWRDSFHALISESSIFLFQAGVTTVEELAQLDAQLSIEMYQEDFCGIGTLFTFSAQRPAGETTDEQ